MRSPWPASMVFLLNLYTSEYQIRMDSMLWGLEKFKKKCLQLKAALKICFVLQILLKIFLNNWKKILRKLKKELSGGLPPLAPHKSIPDSMKRIWPIFLNLDDNPELIF